MGSGHRRIQEQEQQRRSSRGASSRSSGRAWSRSATPELPRWSQGAEGALEPATDTARYEFDPAGFSHNTEFPLYISGAELKHARFAILAWLNLVVPGVSRIPFLGEQQLPRRLLGERASASASGGPSRWDACAATDTSSTAEEDSNAELLESMQLVEAAEEEVLAERRKKQQVLGLARDGLSVEAGGDSSGHMEDAEFRLQKDGWLLISRFFKEQLGPQALGLVKSMTQ